MIPTQERAFFPPDEFLTKGIDTKTPEFLERIDLPKREINVAVNIPRGS